MVSVQSSAQSYLSPDEYLAGEEHSPIKHEYIDGQVYAMVGATDVHVTIALNTATLIRDHLRGKGCRTYISDMKLRVESANRFFYPDIVVTCDPRDRETPLFKRFPCLIVEVLSPSTEAFDRGDKFVDYQLLETLQEYVLISTTRQRVDRFQRNAEGLWVLRSFVPGQTVQFTSIDFETNLEAIYEDADIETLPDAPAPPLAP
jgi:Uma2 family endonuclease